MKERPIIFNGAMVRAILDGRKTQTRRVVPNWQLPKYTPNIEECEFDWSAIAQRDRRYGFCVFGETEESCAAELEKSRVCPYGQVGDRMWVRETWSRTNPNGNNGVYFYRADERFPECIGGHSYVGDELWKPSIHMPRFASRITLEIMDVRIEKLQDISEEDAIAEGCWYGKGDNTIDWAVLPENHFPTLWASIYGEENWKANPWVWVVEFRRIE
ncbi:morphogenetic protein [Xenorhabdus griffiniae]|uniref:morphogenetic protein n=1 Tax=Xenorhabdus griffiniae TaxID=351672 RepID=UPI0030CCBE03